MPGIVRVSEVVRTTRMSLHSTGTGQYNDCEEDLEVYHDSSPLKVTFGIANSTRRDTRTPTDISDLTAQPQRILTPADRMSGELFSSVG